MSRLFDPITFHHKPLLMSHKGPSNHPKHGYYHWHQCCEILFVHEGTGLVAVHNQSFEIRKGMLFFFPPFVLHKVYAQVTKETPYVRTVLHADHAIIARYLDGYPRRAALFNQLLMSSHRLSFSLDAYCDELNTWFSRYDHATSVGLGGSQEEISLLFLGLLSVLQEASQAEAREQDLTKSPAPTHYSEQIMRWLAEHYQQELDLDRLAAQLHLSKSYVSRIFRRETGSSITEYLTGRRIIQASHLLETTDLSVEQIGAHVGLENTSHFIHTFKLVVGLTPLKYRQAKARLGS